MTLIHYIAGFPRSQDMPTTDSRASLRRLVDLLQAILPERPAVTAALEHCIETIVIDEMRCRIHDRLVRLSPEDLAKVEALTAQLADPEPPGDEVA